MFHAELAKVIRWRSLNKLCSDHRSYLVRNLPLCLEGPRPLTVVLSQIAAHGLCARIGRPAVPHVLAARVHPCAPRAPAGLLLVSGAPRVGRGAGKGRGCRLALAHMRAGGLRHVASTSATSAARGFEERPYSAFQRQHSLVTRQTGSSLEVVSPSCRH